MGRAGVTALVSRSAIGIRRRQLDSRRRASTRPGHPADGTLVHPPAAIPTRHGLVMVLLG